MKHKYRIMIYKLKDKESYIAEKYFNNIAEIEYMVSYYEGFWGKIINLQTSDVLLEGALDDSFLDERYYKI